MRLTIDASMSRIPREFHLRLRGFATGSMFHHADVERTQMKHFRLLLLIAFACGITGAAKAYRINVLDPISTNHIYSEPFNVVLRACTPADLPTSLNPGANGCFSGENDTPNVLTTLEIIFPNQGILAGQPLVCSQTSVSIFNASSCGVYNGFQVFFFSGLDIKIGDAFLIVEEGVSPGPDPERSLIPAAQATSPPALVIPSAVPEPSSIILLSTGLLIGGFFVARKRGLPSLPVNSGFSGS
jgi:hypothetical protein